MRQNESCSYLPDKILREHVGEFKKQLIRIGRNREMLWIWLGMILCLLCIVAFGLIMHYERRTLWSGFSFLLMLGCLGGYALMVFLRFDDLKNNADLAWIVVLIGLIVGAIFLAIPFVVLVTYFIQGIRVIRKEGFHFSNLLSLFFAFAFLLCVFVWPIKGVVNGNNILLALFILIEVTAFYLLFVMSIYVVSGVLNLIHVRKNHNFDYIIVLGAAVFGDRVPPLLAGRIEKGLELMKKNPNAKVIMSGGQGPGENLPEGEAMAKYALEHGASKERILIENKSTDTMENLRNSRAMMPETAPKIAVVTTSYHVFRALILARQQKIKCVGYGAKTKWYFTLNALIREFVGYLSLKRKLHGVILVILLVLTFIADFWR